MGKHLFPLNGSYVDELANAGDYEFQIHTRKTLENSEAKPIIYDQFDLYGSQIRTLHDGSLQMSHRFHWKTLKQADVDGSFQQFRCEHALISWMANTRSDISSTANRSGKVTEKTYGSSKVEELSKGVQMIS